jgi:hypothetical protein
MNISLLLILSLAVGVAYRTCKLSTKYLGRVKALQVINRRIPEFEATINLGLLGWADGQSYVNGQLTVNFVPWLPSRSSKLETITLPLPLGIELEQSEEDGMIRIINLSGTGSADGSNVRIGDILRALTAREKRMVYPQGNVALGGIGRPQLVTSFLPLKKGVPLDLVLDAIMSNQEINSSSDDLNLRRPGLITLIVERTIK